MRPLEQQLRLGTLFFVFNLLQMFVPSNKKIQLLI